MGFMKEWGVALGFGVGLALIAMTGCATAKPSDVAAYQAGYSKATADFVDAYGETIKACVSRDAVKSLNDAMGRLKGEARKAWAKAAEFERSFKGCLEEAAINKK